MKSTTESCSTVSDSLWPHELYSPWNSPSQNTGVGSLSLLQGIFPTQGSNPGLPHCRQILYHQKPERKWSHSVVSDSLWPHGLLPTRLLCPWDWPGKNTGVGCNFLLQEIFLIQGLNPGLPHCRQMLYRLSHQNWCLFFKKITFGFCFNAQIHGPYQGELSRYQRKRSLSSWILNK